MIYPPWVEFLWVWAETGYLGGLLYVSMIVFATWSAYKSKKTYLVMAMVGYSTIACFSAIRERPFPSLMLILFIAMACERKKVIRRTELLLCAMTLTVVVFGFHLRSSIWTKRMRATDDWNSNLQLTQGETVFTRLTHVGLPYAWWRAMAHFHADNMEMAAFEFKRAYRYNPCSVPVLNGAGVAAGLEGDLEKAREYFTEALRIAPDYKDSTINLRLTEAKLKRKNHSNKK